MPASPDAKAVGHDLPQLQRKGHVGLRLAQNDEAGIGVEDRVEDLALRG